MGRRFQDHGPTPERREVHDLGLLERESLVWAELGVGGGRANSRLRRGVMPVNGVTDYFGPQTNRCARLGFVGGGQCAYNKNRALGDGIQVMIVRRASS